MIQRIRTSSDDQSKEGPVALSIPRGPSGTNIYGLHASSSATAFGSSNNIYGLHASASDKLLRRLPSEVIQNDALTLLRTPTTTEDEARAAVRAASQLPASFSHKLPLAGMLCTGTALTIVAQLVTDQGIAHPSVQVLAWVKFASTLAWSVLSSRLFPAELPPRTKSSTAAAPQNTATPPSRRAKTLMTLIGLLDVVSYALHCLGFALCGAALSTLIFAASSQLFTAGLSWVVLGRRFNRGQLCALGLVCCGLAVRGISAGGGKPAHFDEEIIGPGQARALLTMLGLRAVDSGSLTGVAAMLASSMAYAAMSVAYEKLITTERTLPSHADVMVHVAKIGVAANTLYQVVYTLPRWPRLVSAELAASGTSGPFALLLLVLFGTVFNLHSTVQGMVFRSEGSLGVGLVNAVRGASVSAVCGAVLCSTAAPQHCLTHWSALSALIVSMGGIAWIAAGPLVQAAKTPIVPPLRHRHSRTMSLKTFKEES